MTNQRDELHLEVKDKECDEEEVVSLVLMTKDRHMISGTITHYKSCIQLAVHVQILPHGICNQLLAQSKGGAYQDLAMCLQTYHRSQS